MHRVFFDTNSGPPGPGGNGYWLWFDNSLADLARIPGGPSEGMRVIIYMPDELEMEAALELDPTSKCWIARPDFGTIKHTRPKSK